MMKVLTTYEELNGKKIVFSHMAQFAEQITLGTEDGCVLMVTFDITDFEERQIRVLSESHVMIVLNSDRGKYLREQLSSLGIFDIEKYKKKKKAIEKAEKEKRLLEREEREKNEYKRLKAKFDK